MASRIYLDWNATAPLRPEAKAAIAETWEHAGNPSSVHAEGRLARRRMENARAAIARAVGAKTSSVVFTSGGTEANALALTPRPGGPIRLLISAIEHASVVAGGRFKPEDIRIVPVLPSGVVSIGHLSAMLASGPPAVVSIMLANNETGTIQPITEIAEVVHAVGGLLHIDAVQAFGKITVDFEALGADMMSLSAHKLGGPSGIGALVVKSSVPAPPVLLRGGGQEQGRRAGTENTAGIAAFGAAVAAAMATLEQDAERVGRLRNKLEAGLKRTKNVVVFGENEPRLPNTILFAVPALRAETAVIAFDLAGIAVSSGSACSSGKVQPSHVLTAMGVSSELARSALRLSLGWTTTEDDVQRTIETWRKLSDTLLKQDDEPELERF